MTFDKNEMINNLKLELEVLDKGGYAPSVRAPHQIPQIFRDSVSCPNLGLEIKVEPCNECFLMYFVPPEHREKDNPCHYIPLNAHGDTVASLNQTEDLDRMQSALRSWLQKTIAQMEKAPDSSAAMAEHPLLSAGSAPVSPPPRA